MTGKLDVLKKGVTYIGAAIGGAVILASSNIIQGGVLPTFTALKYRYEDLIFPMPDGRVLGISLSFFNPSGSQHLGFAEAVSVTIKSSECLTSKNLIVSNVRNGSDDYQTNAILSISCRPSGRVTVTLTPQSGSPTEIYNAVAEDGEKVSFPGVLGSYSAGILTMLDLNRVQESPWTTKNRCPRDISCPPHHLTPE